MAVDQVNFEFHGLAMASAFYSLHETLFRGLTIELSGSRPRVSYSLNKFRGGCLIACVARLNCVVRSRVHASNNLLQPVVVTLSKPHK
jgi:hypothetical protein